MCVRGTFSTRVTKKSRPFQIARPVLQDEALFPLFAQATSSVDLIIAPPRDLSSGRVVLAKRLEIYVLRHFLGR